jgi:hypothetical protein
MRDKNNERANQGEQKRRSGSESDQVFSRPNLDRDRAAKREGSQKDVGSRPIERKDEDTLRRATKSPGRESGIGGGSQGAGTGGSKIGQPDEKVAGKGFTMDRSMERQQTTGRPERRDESLSTSPRREKTETPRREQPETPRREESEKMGREQPDTTRRDQPDVTRRQTTTPRREEGSSESGRINRDRDIDRSRM